MNAITKTHQAHQAINRVSIDSLERIGDRCQNIAEYVIYFVNGKDIRHTSQDDIEKSL